MLRSFPLLCVCVLAGCSSKATVVGRVTYNGEPVSMAEVSVVAEDKSTSRSASSDRDGNVILVDAPLGNGRLLVKATRAAAQPIAKGVKPLAATGKWSLADTPPPIVKNLVPMKYSDFATTPLKVTLTSGRNEVDLALVD